MLNFVAITRQRHANLHWQRPDNYRFAAKDAIIPLVLQEVPRAMMSMAIAFVEEADSYSPVAIQGVRPGTNKFVTAEGRWLGDYVPAVYRAYPFRLAQGPGGPEILCIDEAGAQVNESGKGEAFFSEDGSPAPPVHEVLHMLNEVEKDRRKTRDACAALKRHDLFEPWPLQAQEDKEVIGVTGLFRVSERKLFTLDPAALVDVRDSWGLTLAFGQLFSMQQLQKLAKLGLASNPPGQPPGPKLGEENGIISFANL